MTQHSILRDVQGLANTIDYLLSYCGQRGCLCRKHVPDELEYPKDQIDSLIDELISRRLLSSGDPNELHTMAETDPPACEEPAICQKVCPHLLTLGATFALRPEGRSDHE